MVIRMICTAAGPDYIMHAGKSYIVPNAIGKKMIAAKTVGGTAIKKERDGREIVETVWGGPCAVEVTDPREIAKATRLPAQPDPEDKQVMDESEYLESEDEE